MGNSTEKSKKNRKGILERFLLWWQNSTHLLEGVLVDNISATTPWLAPIIPAWLAYRNMVGKLGFEPWVALVGAIAIEFIGLAAVNTALELWQYNDSKRQKDASAPFGIAFAAGLFYIVIVITVNALLDISVELPVRVASIVLLSLLSVDAGMIIAIRSQHRRVLSDITSEKELRRIERQQEKNENSESHGDTHPQSSGITVIPIENYETYVVMNKTRNGQGAITAKELITNHGVAPATAYRWYGRYNGESNGVGEDGIQ